MRSLYSILESIADDDDTKVSGALGDAVIEGLIEHGIYYATGSYDGAGVFKDEFVKYVNGELYFYDHSTHYGCSVCIDCQKASKYLKAIKAIHAPKVYFLDTGAANVDLPKVYGLKAMLRDAPRSLNNFEFEYENVEDKFVDMMSTSVRVNPEEKSFRSVAYSSSTTPGVYIESYHSTLHLVNCNFIGDKNNNSILSFHCDDLKFSNVKCDFPHVNIYDPSLFGPGYDMSNKLDKIFDTDYTFTMIGDMGKGNSLKVDRKTKSFDSIVAYFNNKKYGCPSASPFRVTGKLSDVLDIKGFTNPKLVIQFRNNNVLVEFTKNLKRAEAIQMSDTIHYKMEDKQMTELESTRDRFFVVFANAKHG